ncbi:MAG: hypothetical protein ABI411_18640 [Tahibacter sp.]
MSQNLVSLSYTEAQLATLSETLKQLESQLSGLVTLTAQQRRTVPKMGAKSEAFCRQTLVVAGENPQVMPPMVSVSDAQADLLALDQLRPLFARLVRLGEHASDTETALGSDVMATSLQCYRLLRDVGRNQGLESLKKEVGARFARSPRSVEAKAA